MTKDLRNTERGLAVASFCVAAALSFISLFLSDEHEIASANLMAIAQFLLFCGSVLGIDYHYDTKIKTHGHGQN